MLGNLGPFEWVVILVVAFLLFGSRIPFVARRMWRTITGFKEGIQDTRHDSDDFMHSAGHQCAFASSWWIPCIIIVICSSVILLHLLASD